MKPWLIGILVLSLLGAVGMIYKMGGDARQANINLAQANATIDQLKKDKKSLEELKYENIELQKKIDHANAMYAKIKDTTGCFRSPVPDAAVVELRNLYDSITGGARSGSVREGKDYISEGTGDSGIVSERARGTMERSKGLLSKAGRTEQINGHTLATLAIRVIL